MAVSQAVCWICARFLIHHGQIARIGSPVGVMSSSCVEALSCGVPKHSRSSLYLLADFLKEVRLFGIRFGSAVLHADSGGAILSSHNPIVSQRTKHIDVRYHYLRDLVQSGVVSVRSLPSSENVADILTKGLGREAHEYLSQRITGRQNLL
uniref:Reverse transcriptase Ty1/copia-type domain-containing protein n=1 Tax=Vitrella brassicaformis TaxID=1169539 RepID=A0A7S1P2F0_9ALVE|mmetsp:Transcript_22614/g.55771  ORF Transcript_22614/g.55771 Transcript_22614/m.55771 type:complete len:151 (+) Transcript_22614:128-580(+)